MTIASCLKHGNALFRASIWQGDFMSSSAALAGNCFLSRTLPCVVFGFLCFLACQSLQSQAAPSSAGSHVSPEFREPVILSTKDGVVEVRLTAHQGAATLDTVAKPVQHFLL